MADISNYKYLFVYIDDDKRVESSFSASICLDDLVRNLREFLCGCGWSEDKLKEYIRLEDEEDV